MGGSFSPVLHLPLIDIGDLLLVIALVFSVLILLFEALERRRENRREEILLEAIAREYAAYRQLGHF